MWFETTVFFLGTSFDIFIVEGEKFKFLGHGRVQFVQMIIRKTVKTKLKSKITEFWDFWVLIGKEKTQ